MCWKRLDAADEQANDGPAGNRRDGRRRHDHPYPRGGHQGVRGAPVCVERPCPGQKKKKGRPPREPAETAAAATTTRTLGAVIKAYVALTKPRIIELLLITTLPVMFLAARGLPPLWTATATMV